MAKKDRLSPPAEGFNLASNEINSLPDPIDVVSTELETSSPNEFLVVDSYHGEVANRSHLRRKIFLKWDTSNGFFKTGDDIVACGPGQGDLLATVLKVNYPWQFWENMGLVCENPDPGVSPQMGLWTEPNGQKVDRACDTCPKNQKNGAKGSVCKDALQIAMSVIIGGNEKTVGIQTANFKVVADFDDFLDVLKSRKLRLSETTIKIGRGPAIDVRGKKMFGWKLDVVANKPLSQYMRENN
jgi:hypothetical protein